MKIKIIRIIIIINNINGNNERKKRTQKEGMFEGEEVGPKEGGFVT